MSFQHKEGNRANFRKAMVLIDSKGGQSQKKKKLKECDMTSSKDLNLIQTFLSLSMLTDFTAAVMRISPVLLNNGQSDTAHKLHRYKPLTARREALGRLVLF